MIGTIRTTVKAVVVGAKESGKTSLLTSLYSNLKQLNNEELNLGEWELDRCPDLDEGRQDGPAFDIERACDSLIQRKYPRQTKDWSIMKLEVHLKRKKPDGWKWGALCKRGFQLCTLNKKIVTLELLDLPGERMSDLALMLKKEFEKASFREWSTRVESKYKGIQGDDKYKTYEEYIDRVKKILKGFKDGQKKNEECWAEIIKAYKEFLPLIRVNRVAYYAPSTIRLTEDGMLVPAKDADEFKLALENGLEEKKNHTLVLDKKEGEESQHRDVYIGLSDAQFAPLPQEAFDDGSEQQIVAGFEKAYDKYYEKIIKQLSEKLKNVNQVYYLVDVLNLLRDGREKMDLEKRFGSSFFKLFRRPQSNTLIGEAVDWFSELFNSVKKICLVATQADKVPIWKWDRNDDGKIIDDARKEVDDSDKDKIRSLRKSHPNVENIKGLLKSLFGVTIKNELGSDIGKEMFVCSAITSTVCVGDNKLEAYWQDEKTKEAKQREPVPKAWPTYDEEWAPETTFKYERPKRCLRSVDPRVSALPHANLDEIVKSMLEI